MTARRDRDPPIPSAPHRSVYEGREKIGSVKQFGDQYIAHDRRGQILGRFDNARAAIEAVAKAASS